MLKQSLLEQFQENLKQNTTRHCTKITFGEYLKKFKTYGTVNNLLNQRKSKVFEDTQLMEKAKDQILATTSLRNSARELGLSLYTTFLIRKSFSNLHPYKLKVLKVPNQNNVPYQNLRQCTV